MNIKEFFTNNDNCTGCMACVSVCPKNALTIKEKKDGFLYPKINVSICIKCEKCISVCPNNKIESLKNKNYEIYAAYAKDRDISKKSRSGGLSFLLGKKFIEEGNIFYGVIIDENFLTKHIRCSNMEELSKTQGSKYVQSYISKDIYKQIENDLNNNKKVLFTGTPCQCAGICSYFNNENLYIIEIICHGVMSPKYVREYIKDKEKSHGPLKEIDFREKKKHFWKNHYVGLTFENDKFISLRDYVKIFYYHVLLRKSCYLCPYTTPNRVSDITLGDYWGVEEEEPEMFDKWGVSIVFLNSQKGISLFNEIKEFVKFVPTEFEKVAKKNKRLISFMGPNNKREFYVNILNIFGAKWVYLFYRLEKKLRLIK